MNKVNSWVSNLSFLVLMVFSASVYAVPITGHLSMGGEFQFTDSTGVGVSLAEATGIDFLNASGDTGVGGIFTVVGTSGDFSSVTVGTQGDITDFQFDPFAGTITDFWTLGVDGFSFDLNEVTSINKGSINIPGYGTYDFISLTGNGVIMHDGFDDTVGTWSLSGDATNGIIFGWSSTTTAQGVPEPSVLAMLGIGLLGFGLVRTRRKN